MDNTLPIKIGFSNDEVPQRITKQISDNTPSKVRKSQDCVSHGLMEKSFEFSDKDSKSVSASPKRLPRRASKMDRGNEPYETLATALKRESVANKDVLMLETMGTMRERMAVFQGDRKKSLMTDDLIPTSMQSAALDA